MPKGTGEIVQFSFFFFSRWWRPLSGVVACAEEKEGGICASRRHVLRTLDGSPSTRLQPTVLALAACTRVHRPSHRQLKAAQERWECHGSSVGRKHHTHTRLPPTGMSGLSVPLASPSTCTQCAHHARTSAAPELPRLPESGVVPCPVSRGTGVGPGSGGAACGGSLALWQHWQVQKQPSRMCARERVSGAADSRACGGQKKRRRSDGCTLVFCEIP